MSTAPTIVAVSIVLFSGACARLGTGPAMNDVKQLVARRAPNAVQGNDVDSERELKDRLAALLGEELTLDAAVRVALLNNRKLRATYERLGVAQADLVQAGLLPNPFIHAGLRLPVTTPGASAELSLTQDLITAIQIPMRKRVSGAALEAAKLEVAQSAIDLIAEVKTAFYTLQGAQQMLELRETIAKAAGVAGETAKRQRAAGNITDLELASEQAGFAEAKLELAHAEAEVLTNREELNNSLGLWGVHTAWKIAPRLPDVPSDKIPLKGLERLAITQRLDLAAARQQTAVGASALGLTRLQALFPAGDIAADAEREPDGGWGLGPAIELPLLIFDQGQAAVARSSAELRESSELYAALAVQVRSEVRKAHMRAESARARAVFYRDVALPLRHRILGQMQLEYNAMQVGVFQLLQARREEIEAARNYSETVREYWVGRTELERAVGGDLQVGQPATSPTEVPVKPDAAPASHHHHGG